MYNYVSCLQKRNLSAVYMNLGTIRACMSRASGRNLCIDIFQVSLQYAPYVVSRKEIS